MEKKIRYLIIFVLLLAGFLIRVFFVDKILVGDLYAYAEWGQKLVQLGFKDYYTRSGWFIAPVYPPFSQLVFGGLYFIYDHKYVLAQLHNVIRFPPAGFIEYFYANGYYLLLKLPGILSDLGISLIIYKILNKLTGSYKKSILGLSIFLFNPITIFLSGVWGQTDSVVALLGMISFLLLDSGNVALSMPALFLSVYFKPSWSIFGLLYLFLLYFKKPKIKSIIFGVLISFVLFVLTTLPFAKGNLFIFTWKIFNTNIPLPLGLYGKASNSAFNFYTIFLKIDIDMVGSRILGISAGIFGRVMLLIVNLAAFILLKKQKANLLSIVGSLFLVGLGTFLFSTQMLERYFFPALAPMIIIMVARPKLLFTSILLNLVFLLNIIYAFYRPGSDEIGRPFVNNNFLLIRLLSLVAVLSYLWIAEHLLVLQSKRG